MSIETPSIPDDLKQRLVDSLDKVAEWVKQAEAFTVEQAPLVVQDILSWGWYGSIVPCVGLFLISLVMGIAAAIFFFFGLKADEKQDGDTATFCAISVVFLVVFMWLPFGLACEHGMKALKVKEAPRVYILEQIGVLK